jgi:cyclophilin family peptidyl-prolyl cis-trans isomerase
VVAEGQPHGNYYSNPPTSGWTLASAPISPGIYDQALKAEDIPAFLERGGVWVLYNCPGGCPDLVNQLVPIVNTATGQGKPVGLAPYELMTRKIALVAWQRLLTLDRVDEAAITTFINAMACRYNPDGSPSCPTAAGTKQPAKDAGSFGFTGRPTATATPRAAAGKYSAPPPMTIDPNKTYLATIVTDKGPIVVQLDPKAAPQTVNNFVFLAREGFYDGVTFHRVIPGFVAQGGDPTGTGAGGPGYSIPDEPSPLKHEAGVIAMAKAGPNTAGSQFYITLEPQPALDGNYTVFGKVLSGLDVARALTPRDPGPGVGNLPPGDKIQRITIEER